VYALRVGMGVACVWKFVCLSMGIVCVSGGVYVVRVCACACVCVCVGGCGMEVCGGSVTWGP